MSGRPLFLLLLFFGFFLKKSLYLFISLRINFQRIISHLAPVMAAPIVKRELKKDILFF